MPDKWRGRMAKAVRPPFLFHIPSALSILCYGRLAALFMNENKSMAALNVGESGVVSHLRSSPDIRRRFLDLGLTAGTRVVCVGKSPLKDPSAYLIRGKTIAIRFVDAQTVALV